MTGGPDVVLCAKRSLPFVLIALCAAVGGLLVYNILHKEDGERRPSGYYQGLTTKFEVSAANNLFNPTIPTRHAHDEMRYFFDIRKGSHYGFSINSKLPPGACKACDLRLEVKIHTGMNTYGKGKWIDTICKNSTYFSKNLVIEHPLSITVKTQNGFTANQLFEVTFHPVKNDTVVADGMYVFNRQTDGIQLRNHTKGNFGINQADPSCHYAAAPQGIQIKWWYLAAIAGATIAIVLIVVGVQCLRRRRIETIRRQPLPPIATVRRMVSERQYANTRNRNLPAVLGSNQLASAMRNSGYSADEKPPEYEIDVIYEISGEVLPSYDDILEVNAVETPAYNNVAPRYRSSQQ